MPVTTKDIAEACGVSRGTVDRALNDRPGINEETKKMVLETAKELGYRPNYIAQSLAKGKTMTLGVIVFDLHNRYFAQMVDAIESFARSKGYFVYLTLTETDPQIEKDCINHLVDRKVDGIIICPVNGGEDYENYLEDLGIPVVTVGNKISNNFSRIGINDKQAMKDAVNFVLDSGYENIIYYSPPLKYLGKTNVYGPEQRYLGFKEALRNAGDEISSFTIEHKNYNKILDKMDFKSGETAILCTSDTYALRILNYLKERNIKVPEDVGLMGIDNIDVLKYVEPALTTVSYPTDKMGKIAVNRVVSEIQDKRSPKQIFLEHKIIERESI